MNRLLTTLLAAAAAGGTAVLLARLLRTEPRPAPRPRPEGGPLIDADAFTDEETRLLLAELDAYTGDGNA